MALILPILSIKRTMPAIFSDSFKSQKSHTWKRWANFFKLHRCVLEKSIKNCYNLPSLRKFNWYLPIAVIGPFCTWKRLISYTISIIMTKNKQNPSDIVPLLSQRETRDSETIYCPLPSQFSFDWKSSERTICK